MKIQEIRSGNIKQKEKVEISKLRQEYRTQL